MPIMPELRRRPTSAARRSSAPKTTAPSPYGESFAFSTASSSSRTLTTAATGPNVSSVAISISWVTSVSTVGITKLS